MSGDGATYDIGFGLLSGYEVFEGGKYVVNQPGINKALLPVEQYLRLQGRFSHLTGEDIRTIQNNVNKEWERLLNKAGHPAKVMADLVR